MTEPGCALYAKKDIRQIGKGRHFLARWIPVWAAVTWALRVYDFIPFAVKNI